MNFATTSKAINQFKGTNNPRNMARHLALDAFGQYYKFSGQMASAFKINRIHFLLFHHLFEDEVENFRGLIKTLSKDHSFISHSEAVNMINNGEKIDRPYISLSSDDGLISNIRAAEVLNEFGIKACFFVCPSMIGETDMQKITQFNKERLNCPPMEYMNWQDLETLLKNGHELGNHTFNHINFSETSANAAMDDVVQAKRILDEKFGSVDHFAWPYGTIRHFSNAARSMVFEVGHRSISSAIRGCHTFNSKPKQFDEVCLRRENVIFSWPTNHILYFLAKGALSADPNNDYFPYPRN